MLSGILVPTPNTGGASLVPAVLLLPRGGIPTVDGALGSSLSSWATPAVALLLGVWDRVVRHWHLILSRSFSGRQGAYSLGPC